MARFYLLATQNLLTPFCKAKKLLQSFSSAKNILPPVTAAHQVITRLRVCDPQGARHPALLRKAYCTCQSQPYSDPFGPAFGPRILEFNGYVQACITVEVNWKMRG
jgi:hypothetical protein